MTAFVPLLRRCPVCLSGTGGFLHHQKFIMSEGHPLEGGYAVVACEGCGFCFADTNATQEEYDAYYASLSKYADAASSTGGGFSSWDAERLDGIARQIGEFEEDCASRILDVGCAGGGLLTALKERGFKNLVGIDPSLGCVKAAGHSSESMVYQGTLSHLPEIGRFRGVVLSHVLEHVHDLRAALSAVANLLEPDGWIYVETPDAMRYGDYLVSPFQDFNTEHINHFSRKGLANLMACCGFETTAGGVKTILSAPDMPYPAAFSFGRRGVGMELDRDWDLQNALRAYVEASRKLLDRIDGRIRGILEEHPRLIVWGVGQLTLKLLSDTSLGSAQIAAFVDKNPVHHGKKLRGIPVVAPEELPGKKEPILVASLINGGSIREDIAGRQLPNIVVTLEAGGKV